MSADNDENPGLAGAPGFAEAIKVGTVVAGTYEITGLLGKGGMGAVWAARHLRLPGKRAAIKVLLGGAAEGEALVRFRREAEIASRLGHPNIVEVHDFNMLADGTPYQVLEFLSGESLGARLRRGPIPLEETLPLVRQMGAALQAAHREGVVHRDLKPENIFLVPVDDGGSLPVRVKILDFGISKIRGSQTLKTQDHVLIGTPQYMSPEQAHGQNQSVDARTDVFALGAIVYEMLSGRTAFVGDSVVSVILNVVQGQPAPLAGLCPALPEAVTAAVHRALAKDPERRFPDVGAFVQALTGRALETRPHPAVSASLSHEEAMGATLAPTNASAAGATSLAPPGPVTSAPPVPRARGRRWLVGAAAIALGAAAVAVLLTRGSAPPLAPPSPAPVSAQAPPVSEKSLAPANPPAAPPADPDPAPPPAAEGEVVSPARMSGRPAQQGRGEALPAAVVAELAEAERLLAAGQTAEAVRLARHTLLVRRSGRAFALMALAACRSGDLTNTRAHLLNVKGLERRRVIKACRAQGLDLR